MRSAAPAISHSVVPPPCAPTAPLSANAPEALSWLTRPDDGRPPTLESTTGAEPPHLARKPNYDFEKRRKELDRKAKKDAKREERLQRKKDNAANGVEGVDPDLEGIALGPQPTADEDAEDAQQ